MRRQPVLEIKNLRVAFKTEDQQTCAVNGVNLALEKGRILGLAGESGCGKSVTAMSILRLLPKPAAKILDGEIFFRGRDLIRTPAAEMPSVRGRQISMIFQEPMTALNPVHSIQRQIMEVFQLHFQGLSRPQMLARAVRILEQVNIPDPAGTLKRYPHQLSGGMRQRVLIAMALACEPEILIADEPTTALDVTVQAQILDLIRRFQQEKQMAVMLITHDLGVIAENCDDVAIMYAGKIVEKSKVRDLFHDPRHPYTRGLLSSIPALADRPKSRLSAIPGQVASLTHPAAGCQFATRCQMVDEICRKSDPQLRGISPEHWVACHLHSN